jgi:hypothetical protein
MTDVLTDADRALATANEAANEASGFLVRVRGLADLIDRFRFRDPSTVIPAPGIHELPDEVEIHAIEAMRAAATCRILTLQAVGDEDDDRPGLLQEVNRASDRAQGDAADAQRLTRQLAQLLLGVAQVPYDGEDVELVERSAIAMLQGSSMADDEPPLRSRTVPEFEVELAGVIARVLLEAGAGAIPSFALVAPRMPPITVVATSPPDYLEMNITDDGQKAELLSRGWLDDGQGVYVCFSEPITIIAVSTLLATTIAGTFNVDVADVRIETTGTSKPMRESERRPSPEPLSD